jgi:hypothetical protein
MLTKRYVKVDRLDRIVRRNNRHRHIDEAIRLASAGQAGVRYKRKALCDFGTRRIKLGPCLSISLLNVPNLSIARPVAKPTTSPNSSCRISAITCSS